MQAFTYQRLVALSLAVADPELVGHGFSHRYPTEGRRVGAL